MARDRATVRAEDHAAALAVVSDWAERQSVHAHTTAELLELVGMVAAVIADGRHRDVPGERGLVDANMDVPAHAWRLEDQLRCRLMVRRTWAAKLETEGLRPLDWPPVVTTFLRWRAMDGTEQPPTLSNPMVECEEGQADVVRLTIHGLAVAE